MSPLPLNIGGSASMPGAAGMPGQNNNMSAPAPVGMGGFPPIPPNLNDPSQMKYTNETQQDGTILIRVLNPDGSSGPVVQIVPPPKMQGAKKK